MPWAAAQAIPLTAVPQALPVATLGPARRLPPPAVRWWNTRTAVWIAMGVVGVALAGLLVRLARQLKPSAG